MSRAAAKQPGYGAPLRWESRPGFTYAAIRRAAGVSDADERRLMVLLAREGIGFAQRWVAANPTPARPKPRPTSRSRRALVR